MAKTPFEELQAMHPSFVFKNITNIPQRLTLLGDSMQVQPYGTAKVPSRLMSNFPETRIFTTVIPTVEDMMAAGLVKSAKTPVPVKSPMSSIRSDVAKTTSSTAKSKD